MTTETASTLRIAYYDIVATLYARSFDFVPAFEGLERNYRVIVELEAEKRHGKGRVARLYSTEVAA